MGHSIPNENGITTQYQQMYGRMAAYAFCVLGDRKLAEEATQDTFCLFCAKAEETLSHETPQRQLMETLQLVLRKIQRHRGAMNRLLMAALQAENLEGLLVYDQPDTDLPCEDLDAHADFQLLKRVVLEGCTMLEAAEESGITVEICKQRIQRIGKLLKRKLPNL